MRTARTLFVLLFAAVTLMSVGCAKEKRNGGGAPPPPGNYPPNGPYIPPGQGPGQLPGTNWEYGGTAELLTNNQALGAYLGWTPNAPTDIKVNLNLRKYGQGFGGVVTIAFTDNGVRYEDTFSSLVNPWGMVQTNEENHKYNIWFEKNGQIYWHGFFQDHYGSIVIVIDEVVDLGDGQGPQSVNGEIWFRNHPLTYAPLSPTSCWFVSLGPYDCRTWKKGHGVDTTMAIYPTADDTYGHQYQKLGEFIGLDVPKAFNNEVTLK